LNSEFIIYQKISRFIRNKKCYISPYKQGTPEWLAERVGLITGSVEGSIIIYANTHEKKQILAEQICGVRPILIKDEYKERVSFGTLSENNLRQDFENKKGFKVHELGFCKLLENPSIFGVSVDGILENGDIIEIKTSQKSIPKKQYANFTEIQESHIYQMQQGMAILGARNCHYWFYSRSDNATYHRLVPFDQTKWLFIRQRATIFYHEYMVPILININSLKINIPIISNIPNISASKNITIENEEHKILKDDEQKNDTIMKIDDPINALSSDKDLQIPNISSIYLTEN